MATRQNGVPEAYYESPNSMLDMPPRIEQGLLAIGSLATVSILFTTALLSFITWRMVSWRAHYTSYIGRNQCVVLIYQLILADCLQSLGFLISFHWAAEQAIWGPSSACFAQGWLIQIGDVSSAFFVLAIALHTTLQVTMSKRISYQTFTAGVCSIWAVSLILTSLAPITGGRYVFMRAGDWCWISNARDDLRLLLHYLWIFIVQFGSIIIYSAGFLYLFKAKRPGAIMIQGASVEALNKAARAMLAYALAYTILTLPLAAGRMAAMSGNTPSDAYYLFAGCLFTSSGWVDTLLYAFTRRSLLFQELSLPGSEHHPGGPGTGRGADMHHHHPNRFRRQGSTDDMLAEGGFGGFGGIKTERTVKVELDDLESQDSADGERTPKFYHTAEAYAT
ncbi:G protein-coupled glucose receptor regulating Gpa2-domain-containing protein [Xylariaceae sp. FL0804]|nr:G protein-coupled glucose receptor regulating Gpa2-domain-containing protein [Xylariaceae sp. FL0804]